MSDLDPAVDNWFRSRSMKVKRELARVLKEEADNLAADIKDAAPEGETHNLKQSVKVRRGRHTLELFVEAGGELTTKEVRSGSGVQYDYALAAEFGNSHVDAQPFFYSTFREREQGIRDRIAAAVERALND